MVDGFDPVIGALNTSMNLRLLNHNVITSNITNSDTPNYKAQRVEFEGALRDALGVDGVLQPKDTHPGHRRHTSQGPVTPQIYEDPFAEASLDGNTVDRSAEMVKMAENQLLYDASAQMLKKKLGMLKYAVGEGGR